MAAPKRNRNAQKWTKERVYEYLGKLEMAAADPANLFWGQELEKLGLYRDVWSYWKRKYSEDEDLINEMELIEQLYECNLVNAAYKAQIPAGIAIICLKHVHGWRESPVGEMKDAEIEVDKESICIGWKYERMAA